LARKTKEIVMNFEVIDHTEVPEELKGRRGGKYAAVKAALKDLPLGKALRWKVDGLNVQTLKANIPLWAAQFNCYFTVRSDRQKQTLYVWKIEKPHTEDDSKLFIEKKGNQP
jgi:hypothetical protein